MKQGNRPIYGIVSFALICLIFVWIYHSPDKDGSVEVLTDHPAGAKYAAVAGKGKETAGKQHPDFPVNDKMELPFLGTVSCHVRQEKIQFTAKGKQVEWPFKTYYLPNGMLVRAEFFQPGRKDYEGDRFYVEEAYRSGGESIVGFPEKAAPASLSKVLQSLYESEPFDRASKINITWVLREGTDNVIRPCFIANLFGVSQGVMNIPDEDEGFLKYRVLLTPEGGGRPFR